MAPLANGTKVWMTPKRIARGPAAAEAELHRWGELPLRSGRLYGSVASMRAEALRSQREGRGSSSIATATSHISRAAGGLTVTDAVIALVAVGGGFLFGRWLVRHARENKQTVGAAYVNGAAVLGAR